MYMCGYSGLLPGKRTPTCDRVAVDINGDRSSHSLGRVKSMHCKWGRKHVCLPGSTKVNYCCAPSDMTQHPQRFAYADRREGKRGTNHSRESAPQTHPCLQAELHLHAPVRESGKTDKSSSSERQMGESQSHTMTLAGLAGCCWLAGEQGPG
jgi:hypothetical protein